MNHVVIANTLFSPLFEAFNKSLSRSKAVLRGVFWAATDEGARLACVRVKW